MTHSNVAPANEPVTVHVENGEARCASPIDVDSASFLAFVLDPLAVGTWHFSSVSVPTGFTVLENTASRLRLQVPAGAFLDRVRIRLKKNRAGASLPPDETDVDPEIKSGPKD